MTVEEVDDSLIAVTWTVEQGSIHGIVFEDANGNGSQDPDEPGLADREVVLEVEQESGIRDQGSGIGDQDDAYVPVATTTTDAKGRYRFAKPPAGKYRVRLVQPAKRPLFVVPPSGGLAPADRLKAELRTNPPAPVLATERQTSEVSVDFGSLGTGEIDCFWADERYWAGALAAACLLGTGASYRTQANRERQRPEFGSLVPA